MEAKRIIRVHLTRKPGEIGYKSELIRKTYHLPVKDILAFAKEKKVRITPAYIYVMRSEDRKRVVAGTAPQLNPPPPFLRLTNRKDAPKTVIDFSTFSTEELESSFLHLLIQIGTTRALELTNTAQDRVFKALGIKYLA